MTYPDFKKFIIEGVQDNWANDKMITPMIFLLVVDADEHRVVIIPANEYMKSDTHKEILSGVLQNVCSQLNVISYCILSESWKATSVPASESPDREEIIMMFFETKYSSETLYFDIIRDELTDDAIISELKELQSSSGGRFSNLLIELCTLN